MWNCCAGEATCHPWSQTTPENKSACRRLGQGKGYYDTWLARYSAVRAAQGLAPATTVGLGLAEQLIVDGDVPSEEHDLPLDYVCLPDETISRVDVVARADHERMR